MIWTANSFLGFTREEQGVWRGTPPSVHRTQFWSDVTSLSKIVQRGVFGVCHEFVSRLQFVGNKLKRRQIGQGRDSRNAVGVPVCVAIVVTVTQAGATPDGGVHGLYTITGRSDAKGCSLAQPDFAKELGRHNVIFVSRRQRLGWV